MPVKGIGEEREQPLEVQSADHGESWCHLKLSGELDMASAPRVRQAVDDAVGRGRNQVLIDAADVTFIDSSALMVLLTARSELVDGGGTLRLSAASPPVIRILEIAMLSDVLIDSADDESPDDHDPPVG
jgi:anti-sigma B factor antagonist